MYTESLALLQKRLSHNLLHLARALPMFSYCYGYMEMYLGVWHASVGVDLKYLADAIINQ